MSDIDSGSSFDELIDEMVEFPKRDYPFSPEDFSKWQKIIESYIRETNPTVLNLECTGISLISIISILRLVEGSEITNLCLKRNNLRGGMSEISKILVNSKIQKLDLQSCNLSGDDLLHLFEVLNNTLITSLNLHENETKLKSEAERDKFLMLLRRSHLETFEYDFENFFDFNNQRMYPFFSVLPYTSITSFELIRCPVDTLLLFPILRDTQITKLKLCKQTLDLEFLGLALRNSNVTHLNLTLNKITDEGVNMLSESLIQSKVIDLNLSCNEIVGSNSLGSRLKDTQIECLNLSHNPIRNERMFCFPSFLKDSSVETLLLHGCNLDDNIGQKLIASLKFSPGVSRVDLGENQLRLGSIIEFSKITHNSNIHEMDFSLNDLPLDALTLLSDCLKYSKIKTFKLGPNRRFAGTFGHFLAHSQILHPFLADPAEVCALVSILDTIKDSSVTSVDYSACEFKDHDFEKVGSSIVGSSITNLNLSSNYLEIVGTNYLVPHLKFTVITHLNISHTSIGNVGAEAIAKSLKETKILELNMGFNLIDCEGAKLMAPHLQGTQLLNLILDGNDIASKGLEALGEGIKATGIVISVDGITGQKKLLLDQILFRNRIFIHRFVSQFKELAPQIQSGNFHPDGEEISPSSLITLLENLFKFFKVITNKPWVVNILAQDKDLSITKAQLDFLLFKEFPIQFASFIAQYPVSDVFCKVNVLKRAEELNLNSLVEHLLFHRPVFAIDENEGILHPYFYLLLHKFKLPIFHPAIEPDGKAKIIKYFTEHLDINGATDVIQLLNN